jgi:hypothetical protein
MIMQRSAVLIRKYSTEQSENVRYTHVFSQTWDPVAFVGIGMATYFFMFEPREHNSETGKDRWIVLARRAWNRYNLGEAARLDELQKSVEKSVESPLLAAESPDSRLLAAERTSKHQPVSKQEVDKQVSDILDFITKESTT